jgi:hypothetical protein
VDIWPKKHKLQPLGSLSSQPAGSRADLEAAESTKAVSQQKPINSSAETVDSATSHIGPAMESAD